MNFSEPIRVTLSSSGEAKMKKYLCDRIESLQRGLKPLFETDLVAWRRMYEAKPLENVRSFPWKNASNLVVPIIAIHADTLQARIMAAVHKTKPLFVAKLLIDANDQLEDIREAYEQYMNFAGLEPALLDLYRVEEAWYGEAIKYGTSIVKCPHLVIKEDMVVPAGDGTGKFELVKDIRYEGPKPQKLAFEDFLINPSASTIEDADIRIHRRRMQKWELMERRYSGFYDATKVAEIIDKPDRYGPDVVTRQRQDDANARVDSHTGYEEYDIYECWFKWRDERGRAPRVAVWYHKHSDTILRAFYDNVEESIFVRARLLIRDDSFHGYGFCEILAQFQEETSTQHNQRRDNMTVANTMVWRVDENSKLNQGYSIYPSAMLPAAQGEIEPMQHGQISSITIDEERLTMELAERRSGVSPPMQGYGAGQNTKRGVYTAMGTLSLLQEGNRRTDLNISDMRDAHTRLGRVINQDYATFGVNEKTLMQFGKKAELIKVAFRLIKEGKLGLPIYSSSASVNKELEKQNDLLLHNIVTQHYATIAQYVQQISTVQINQQTKDYIAKAINASDRLMKRILKSFDHDDGDALIPTPNLQPQGGQGGAGNRPALPAPNTGASMAGQGGGSVVPFVGSGTGSSGAA